MTNGKQNKRHSRGCKGSGWCGHFRVRVIYGTEFVWFKFLYRELSSVQFEAGGGWIRCRCDVGRSLGVVGAPGVFQGRGGLKRASVQQLGEWGRSLGSTPHVCAWGDEMGRDGLKLKH